jgi:hypothetical protein
LHSFVFPTPHIRHTLGAEQEERICQMAHL